MKKEEEEEEAGLWKKRSFKAAREKLESDEHELKSRPKEE